MRGDKPKLKWKDDKTECGFIRLAAGVEDIHARRVKVYWTAWTKPDETSTALLKKEVKFSPDNSGDLDWMKIRAEKWLQAQAKKMVQKLKRH